MSLSPDEIFRDAPRVNHGYIMTKQGFILNQFSVETALEPEIHLWLSTDEGPAKLIIEKQQPVFFVNQSDHFQVKYSLLSIKDHYVLKPLQLKTFSQSVVSGLYFYSIQHCYEAQHLLRKARITYFEHDLRLSERYLMERFIYGSIDFTGIAEKKSGYIEYRQIRAKPSQYQPQLRVLSLDLECSIDGELYSAGFYSIVEGRSFKKVIMIGKTDNRLAYMDCVDDEATLLKALVVIVNQFDPDIIIGWNVINFDCQLLIKRANVCGIPLALGRDQSEATWRKSRADQDQGFISIAGRAVVDGIHALRSATYSFPSFSLENVSQTLLGRGKKTEDVEHRMEAITHDFNHNKDKLAAYNLEDCVLVWDIFQHTELMNFLVFRSQLTGLSLDKQGGSVAAFTQLYLPLLHRAGYVAPNLPKNGGLASPGGYVMNSKPGLYKNVIVLDYKSLYPSIIRTFKIDPLGLIEGLLHVKKEAGGVDEQRERIIPGFLGAQFCRQKHFLPDIITTLWQQRDEAKKNHDSARSQALKILMNSFYGVLGSGGCRFYDSRLASSITLRGQQIIQQTEEWIEALGYTVIYGDTDSLFVLLDDDLKPSACRSIGHELKDEINDSWRHKLRQEYDLTCFLELEFETHFSQFLMPTIRGSEEGSKKRYAGVIASSEGVDTHEKLVFKGLETVRTDWTPLARQFQEILYAAIFKRENPEAYILQVVQQTLLGEHDDKLIYRKRLRRPLVDYIKNIPPHVRAARLADEKNLLNGKPLRYQNKGWVQYVMTINGPEPVEYRSHPLDYEHYIDKQLQPIADAILPFMGLSFREIFDKQLSLF